MILFNQLKIYNKNLSKIIKQAIQQEIKVKIVKHLKDYNTVLLIVKVII